MLFFELIQASIGRRDRLSMTPSASEWEHLFLLSLQHTLLGVCFHGMARLPLDQRPPDQLMADWVWQLQRTREQNERLNKASVEVCRQLTEDGFDVCLLKGQGNALLYGPMADSRQSGDVDVWVTPSGMAHRRAAKRRTIDYVLKRFPEAQLRFHHIQYPLFPNEVEVEIHFVPIYLNNPFLNRRLTAWYRTQYATQLQHQVEISGQRVAVPTREFNLLYQLLHIYKHIFEEGIGLRQMMDYYYVLTATDATASADGDEAAGIRTMLRALRLEPLAGAVMYVMQEVFALPERQLICPPRKSEGMLLLSEIMQSGDFGHYDTRYGKQSATGQPESPLHRYWRKTKRNVVMAYYYPHEGLWEPVFRLYHSFWRILKLWRL